ISSASTLSTINTTDCIACPWTNGYGEALLTIRLSDVYENFGSNSYEELGEEDLLSAIDTFVHSNGDRSKLDFEEEDEY
ncbi:MAG: hypothetical protein RBS43_08300, partial [Candidatus Cloacimonas sp.]|nr:hypothetical protein [Candidatus Cloacimonas sp.]